MVIIKKLFDFQKSKDLKVEFFAFLGPIFLLGSLFLTSFSTISNKDLFLYSIVGIVLCWKKRERGVIVSLLFLVILSFLKHFQITDHLWQFGLEISMGIGMMLTYFCFEEASDLVESLEEGRKKEVVNSKEMESTIAKERDFHKRQCKNLRDEIDGVKLDLEEREKRILDLKGSIKKLEEEGKVSSEKGDREKELLVKLEEVEKEKAKSFLLNQNLNKMLSKEIDLRKKIQTQLEQKPNEEGKEELLREDLANKQEMILKYEKKFENVKNIESLYKQLREQFEEKKRILNKTRTDLFQTKERLSSLEMEKQSRSFDSKEIRQLERELANFNESFSKIKKENGDLNEIVSGLTEKLAKKS